MSRVNVASSSRVTVVFNPVKVHLGRLRRAVERYAWEGADIEWAATTAEGPGFSQAVRALEHGTDLIIAAGGDGTVRMVALAVSGSKTPMAIVPAGTGNMLARNLGVPLVLEAAVHRAFSGTDRLIDLCRAEMVYPDGRTEHSGRRRRRLGRYRWQDRAGHHPRRHQRAAAWRGATAPASVVASDHGIPRGPADHARVFRTRATRA